MSKELLAISFFKEKSISYYPEKNTGILHFACVHCGGAAHMDVNDTNWNCDKCHKVGNLVSLNLIPVKEVNKSKIFNPREEKKLLNKRLNRLHHQLEGRPNLQQKIQVIKNNMNSLLNELFEK
ncbi:hypothetical protein SAMN05428981_11041 [Bacillus sp. OV194]|nr:hypothetical protein SAMN05428981_11041 [Bacillus sp. OV194]